MSVNELFDIKKYDNFREDNRREVKKATENLPVSLWDTYSSFANCYGGVIILGVKENADKSWEATGIADINKLKKEFWDGVNNKALCSINILTDDYIATYKDKKTGKDIMVITVPPAAREQKPVYVRGDIWNGTYRRNWEGDYHCTPEEIKTMLRDQPSSTMDMKVIENLRIDQLNMNTVRNYRNRHKLTKPGHIWSTLDDSEYLEMIGAAAYGSDKKLHPTAAGLLMFGDEFRIVREFPAYFLDYREMLDPTIRWTDRFYSSTGEWSGNLFDFYFGVYNRLIKDVKVPFRMIGGDRIDDTPVHKALREVLANCLVNTDFYVDRGVVILKNQDYIIFENPGYIRVGKEQMRKGGESDPRNRALMKMFNMIDIGERSGSGVPALFSIWENEGWEDPVIEERFGESSRTVVTVSFRKKALRQLIKSADKKAPIKKSADKKSADKKSADKKPPTKKSLTQYETILQFMEPGKLYQSSDIGHLLAVKDNRTRKILREMLSLGIIEAVGNNKSRRYKLKK
ncbi:MAG: putative DNA binding domain-containing protein [Erysipelotrichaceae bacterium]|nr:putative DNA binding domain-containing protein [Erysipelotrichaceae bacterium]